MAENNGGQQNQQGQQNQGGQQQNGGAGEPWHKGVEAETIGFWQNKGLDLSDPIKFAKGFTEQYRQMEAFRGVPANEILRKLKPDSPEADVKKFWGELGAPADPKEYDFSGIKYADGEAIEPEFAEALRASFARRHVPKETALEIAKDLAKFADGDQATQSAAKTAKLAEERGKLQAEWKQNFDANLFIAKQGAKVLGMTPEQIDALEGIVGYHGVMTAMHRVGVLNKEDRFIAGGPGSTGGAMTREQATARKGELMKDSAWAGRYLAGGATERAEMLNLNRIITGDFESAA